jgi:hypothetical protein
MKFLFGLLCLILNFNLFAQDVDITLCSYGNSIKKQSVTYSQIKGAHCLFINTDNCADKNFETFTIHDGTKVVFKSDLFFVSQSGDFYLYQIADPVIIENFDADSSYKIYFNSKNFSCYNEAKELNIKKFLEIVK